MSRKNDKGISEDWLINKGYTLNKDGSWQPPKLVSKFVNELKDKQSISEKYETHDYGLIEKVAVKEIVIPSADFETNSIYPVTLDITPMGKPRMTQRDKWLKPPRKPVEKYWKYKTSLVREATLKGFKMPESNFHVTFVLPMNVSWSIKKKNLMNHTKHQVKPDVDNMIKGLKDCLCESDSHIWDYRITKIWGVTGKIIINKIK